MKVVKTNPMRVLNKYFSFSSIHIWLGDVRSGKTASLFYWADLIYHNSDRAVYVLHSDSSVLPDYFDVVSDIGEIKNHSVVVFDDLALFYSSLNNVRSEKRKQLIRFLVLSGQKDIILLGSVQNLSLLDVGFLRVSGVNFHLKYMSSMSLSFERDEVKDFLFPMYSLYNLYYSQNPTKALTVAFFYDGSLAYLNPLPSFWSDDLSRLWKNFEV